MGENVKAWLRAAGIRAIKTAAQSALGVIGATATMGGVEWGVVGSAALLAAIVSVLTSVAGLPEIADGANVKRLYRSDKYADGLE